MSQSLVLEAGARTDSGSELARTIETDRRYFEMGAEIVRLKAAELAWIPDLPGMLSAAVVHRIDAGLAAEGGQVWLQGVEAALLAIGASHARFYLDGAHARLDRTLVRAGYKRRSELAMVGAPASSLVPLRLRPIRTEADWAVKLRFHQEVVERPDGHRSTAEQWVALERAKCAAGMEAFLAMAGDDLIGVVGAIRGAGLLRLKNIVVPPDIRRRSYARAIVAELAAYGRSTGFDRLCVFGISGGVGEQLYRATGFSSVGEQIEWTRDLSGDRNCC